MKKLLLFLTVFLFFGFVSAEDVQVYEDSSMILLGERWTEQESEVEKEPEPEPEPKKEPEIEKQEEVQPETKEKPKFFYVQPTVEIGAAMAILPRVGVALDTGFLVGTIQDKTNVYLGLDFDLKLLPYLYGHAFPVLSFPVLVSTVFDIALQNQPVLKSISVRLALGANMWLSRIEYSSSEAYSDLNFYIYYGWGTGFDLVFKNNMVFKFSVEGYWVYFLPDLLVGLGYRF